MRYKFRAKYSEDEDYVVYRKFHYTPRQLGIRGFLATTFAAIAVFLLIPLPDELIVIPPIAAAIQHLTSIETANATFYAYALYKSIGLIFLALAFILGAEYVRDALFSKARRIHREGKELHSKIRETGEHFDKLNSKIKDTGKRFDDLHYRIKKTGRHIGNIKERVKARKNR